MNKPMFRHLAILGLLHCALSSGAAVTSVQQMPLADVLRLAEERSGVSFVVPPCLAKEQVARTIPAVLTPNTLTELLDGYNFGAIWDADGRLVKVVISGRADATGPVCPDDGVDGQALLLPPLGSPAAPQLLRYEPAPAALPERYRQMPPGSVSPVSLPTEQMSQMELGERLDMSLPDGQFCVVMENRFDHDNGDVTWVGYLEGMDSGDRVIVTAGTEGSVGQVITPERTYTIEFENGRTWLVDAGSQEVQAPPEEFQDAEL